MAVTEEFTLNWDAWCDEFRPDLDQHDSPRRYETYGDDLRIVEEAEPHQIWTELDDGTIVNGFRFVNRFCYYLTEKKWENASFYEVIDHDAQELEREQVIDELVEEHGLDRNAFEIYIEYYGVDDADLEEEAENCAGVFQGAYDALADYAREVLVENLEELPAHLEKYFDFAAWAENAKETDTIWTEFLLGKYYVFLEQ